MSESKSNKNVWIWTSEQECLETLSEDLEWLRGCHVRWQIVPNVGARQRPLPLSIGVGQISRIKFQYQIQKFVHKVGFKSLSLNLSPHLESFAPSFKSPYFTKLKLRKVVYGICTATFYIKANILHQKLIITKTGHQVTNMLRSLDNKWLQCCVCEIMWVLRAWLCCNSGRDCIGCAKTGSGKTAAFALPILQKLCEDPYGIFALILSPTRYAVVSLSILSF